MVRSTERGSTLLLFPAGILIVFVLGAMAADSAAVFLGERELANASAAAANDAATEALANADFYERGRVRVADDGARQVAAALVRDALGSRYRNLAVEVAVMEDRITVRTRAEVRRLFAGALPGAGRWVEVGATSTVRAQERQAVGP